MREKISINTAAQRRWQALTLRVTLAFVVACIPAELAAQLSVDELEVHMRLAEKRESITQTIPVRNDDTKPQQVRILVGDWTRDSLGNNMFLEAGAVSESCGDRIKAFPTTFQVAPGATELVRVSYDPAPEDVGCWSIVFVETVTPPPTRPTGEGSFLTIEIRTGVKIYVHRPNEVALGEVQEITVDTAWRARPAVGSAPRDTMLVREVTVRFANTGTAHLRVKSSLEIRSVLGELLREVEGPEAPMTPGSLRLVRIATPTLPPGEYIAVMLLDYGGDEISAAQIDFRVP